ncbi:MAG: single-stranded-DNA-specific exonuclease RecJ [Candidatus Omnitrophota bacterium]
MDNKVWEFIAQDEDLKLELAKKLSVSPFLAALLINRGINEVRNGRSFLQPDWKTLNDPFDLPGMEEAVIRIKKARKEKEPVLIYGDYDADGVTATALLTLFLRKKGCPVFTYLPRRIEEGYGLHLNPLIEAKKQGIKLVITVDCGTSAGSVVKKAREIGLDLIVTDHHLPGDDLPEEIPLVNPHLGWKEEMKSLSGVGVAFELVRAIASDDESIQEYLDLVATGTIADRVPLLGESRTLSFLGLKTLQALNRPAFRQLSAQAGLRPESVDTYAISYIFGPRINAAGRISDADLALQIFLTEDDSERMSIAERLERNNRERQRIEKKVLTEACREIEEGNLNECPIIILGKEDWHQGILGIVAGKIAERYNRPTIVFTLTGHAAKGSGRSIPGFNLFEAVQASRSLLINYGGHHKAVGVTLDLQNMEAFRKSLMNFAEKRITPETLKEKVRIEVLLPLAEVTPELVREMEMLAPYGQDNPAPILASLNLEVQRYSQIVGNKHLKLWLRDEKTFRQAIGFGLSRLQTALPAGLQVDAAYTSKLAVNEGLSQIELTIKSLRESG